MKRILAGLLAAALLLGLCACGAPAVSSSGALIRAAKKETTPNQPHDEDYYDEKTGEYDDKAMNKASDEYYAYWEKTREAMDRYESSALDSFNSSLLPLMLASEQGENTVCSPLNIWFCLAMLAEITDGQARQEVLDAMGVNSREELRTLVSNIWKANYQNSDYNKVLLSSALWLDDSVKYKKDTLATLADVHMADSYSGKPGSDELNKALRDWLNEATGNLLADQIDTLELTPDTIAALTTAIWYKAAWYDEFEESNNLEDTFTAADGSEVTATYMSGTDEDNIYVGDGFTAVSKRLDDNSSMWFLLPDEGVSPTDLLASGAAASFLADPGQAQTEYARIHLFLPKFDVSIQKDLIPVLEAMGISEVMAPGADFSPLTDDVDNIALTGALHGARLTLNEEGVEAAAYTIMMCGAAGDFEDPPEVDFTLNRPFLFGLTSQSGDLLFAGVVNDPTVQ